MLRICVEYIRPQRKYQDGGINIIMFTVAPGGGGGGGLGGDSPPLKNSWIQTSQFCLEEFLDLPLVYLYINWFAAKFTAQSLLNTYVYHIWHHSNKSRL